ncbi:hypothetical protein [Mycobacterium kansasii]|uniref:hypothetical protein n=1 Tax=Mycobacterium kansasii TaxID=1768 RepID=UPI0012EC4B7D|nr:hypothetical protein [Mycobacterium kansasii]
MKRIRLEVTEEVVYERTYEVPDDFDIHDDGALVDLWCNDEDGPTKGFKSVEERWITATGCVDERPVQQRLGDF